MKISKAVYRAGYTTDGTLKLNQGRIVIYNDDILISKGNSPDHLGLLRALAIEGRYNKDKVISDAIRMYYTIENDTIIISANRKIDYEMFEPKAREYGYNILMQLRGSH